MGASSSTSTTLSSFSTPVTSGCTRVVDPEPKPYMSEVQAVIEKTDLTEKHDKGKKIIKTKTVDTTEEAEILEKRSNVEEPIIIEEPDLPDIIEEPDTIDEIDTLERIDIIEEPDIIDIKEETEIVEVVDCDESESDIEILDDEAETATSFFRARNRGIIRKSPPKCPQKGGKRSQVRCGLCHLLYSTQNISRHLCGEEEVNQ